MNIEDMIYNGASEEEIKAEKARQEAALRAKETAAKTTANEQLKAEARAHVINGIIAYCEAFDLEDEPWSDEEVAKLEQMLIKLEEMIPVYIRLAELQGDLGLGLGGSFFGSL